MTNSLVLASLAHHPGRTLASVLGIAVSVILVTLATGLTRGMLLERGRREAQVGAEIMIRDKGVPTVGGAAGPLSMPTSLADAIAALPGVAAVTVVGHYLHPTGSGFDMRLIDGIDYASFVRVTGLRLVAGRGLENEFDALIDSTRARTRRASVGDHMEIFGRSFTIVGIYEPDIGPRIKIPLSTMQRLLGAPDRCSTIFVKAASPEEQEHLAAEIQRRLPDRQILLTRDIPSTYARGTTLTNGFLNAVLLVAAIMGTLTIGLTMYTAVHQQTRQIGILKSLGASRGFIVFLIEKQALLITGLGIALGGVVSLLAKEILERTTALPITWDRPWLVRALVLGLVSSFIGALYPALRAALQDPIKALGYE